MTWFWFKISAIFPLLFTLLTLPGKSCRSHDLITLSLPILLQTGSLISVKEINIFTIGVSRSLAGKYVVIRITTYLHHKFHLDLQLRPKFSFISFHTHFAFCEDYYNDRCFLDYFLIMDELPTEFDIAFLQHQCIYLIFFSVPRCKDSSFKSTSCKFIPDNTLLNKTPYRCRHCFLTT